MDGSWLSYRVYFKTGTVVEMGFVSDNKLNETWKEFYHLYQWFLTLLEVLNPASFISVFTEPFVIGKINYVFFKT